jgi:hypothetical protein
MIKNIGHSIFFCNFARDFEERVGSEDEEFATTVVINRKYVNRK